MNVINYFGGGFWSLNIGESDMVVDTEVYEIDYRGPETHSSIPPPDHSHGKPLTHRQSSWGHPNYPKFKGSNLGRKVSFFPCSMNYQLFFSLGFSLVA